MIRAIKGFDANLQCRGFQFEIGKTYTHDGEVVTCRSGFHAIPEDAHPLSVFDYYPPAGSRFCAVEVSGKSARDGAKIAAEILTLSREIGLGDLATEAAQWVISRATHEGPTAVKKNGLATASGDQGAATASGIQGAATASGDQGAATASGTRGAATASGIQGAATASGDQGAATASGETSCAMATGPLGKVRGDIDGVDLFAREFVWDGTAYERKSIACGTTGRGGIKAGVWYRCEGGKLVEAAS